MCLPYESAVRRPCAPHSIDARLTEIERSLNLLLNVTPVNAAKAWADFERSDFRTVPTLRLETTGIRARPGAARPLQP
jgi:hypothetical protein